MKITKGSNTDNIEDRILIMKTYDKNITIKIRIRFGARSNRCSVYIRYVSGFACWWENNREKQRVKRVVCEMSWLAAVDIAWHFRVICNGKTCLLSSIMTSKKLQCEWKTLISLF